VTEDVEQLQAEVVNLRKALDRCREAMAPLARENKKLEAERDGFIHQVELLEAAFGNRRRTTGEG